MKEKIYSGLRISEGIAIGNLILMPKRELEINKNEIAESLLLAEKEKFMQAIEAIKTDLEKEYLKMKNLVQAEEAEIWKMQLMLLKEPLLYDQTIALIAEENITADNAWVRACNEQIKEIEAIEDVYFQERANDLKDLKDRVLAVLLAEQIKNTALEEECLVYLEELKPSDLKVLVAHKTLGIISSKGGKTSHAAILAKALGIPTVFGIDLEFTEHGLTAILDGNKGVLIVNPEVEVLKEYQERLALEVEEKLRLEEFIHKTSQTSDGHQLEIAANISSIEEAGIALAKGADGIGLLRTEFFYMNQKELPDEESQRKLYTSIGEIFKEKPVIIRTLDIGGDKEATCLHIPKESNPFLGWRAIRICLDQLEVLETQLSSIVKGNKQGNLKIMLPMIISLEEILAVKKVLASISKGEEETSTANIELGIMVETPAAAIMIDTLLTEIDFVSIGTNDLTQYTLAVDRSNEKISNLYDYFHPAVLRLINKVITACKERKKWVGMCGEMAGDELAIPFLVGLGIDELSVNPQNILGIRSLVGKLHYGECVSLSQEVLKCSDSTVVKEILDNYIQKIQT